MFGQAADLDSAVRAVLSGRAARSDALGALGRAYTELARTVPEQAASFSTAIARGLGRVSPSADGVVLDFFSRFPRAPGGPVLAAFVVANPEYFQAHGPVSLCSAVGVALELGGVSDAPQPGLLELGRAMVLDGRGADLLYPMWRRDGLWMEAHLERVLGGYPARVDASFFGLMDRGQAADEALERVLVAADASGRRALREQIRLSVVFDAELTGQLLESLD